MMRRWRIRGRKILHPRHDGGALRIAHAAPVHNLLDGSPAAHACRPIPVECAQVAASDAFNSQLLPGLDHWMSRIELRMGIDIGGWQGLAIGVAIT